MKKVGDNTYMDDNYQLYHLMPNGEYEPFSLMIDAYKRAIEFHKIMSRVGVNFTDEQKAVFQRLADAGDNEAARQAILDELNHQLPSDNPFSKE